MRQCGFIFSLDAFVAFTLTMLTISLFIFTIGTPKPYYSSLEQAHQLAHDTLQAMATSSSELSGHPTYLEQAINAYRENDGGAIRRIMFKVAGGNATSDFGMIPKGFGYSLQFYNFSNQNVSTAYDAGADPLSDRYGKKFTKLQASANTFASLYHLYPSVGESGYCYLTCRGYNGTDPSLNCNATPCDTPGMFFSAGSNTIQLVRLVVYT